MRDVEVGGKEGREMNPRRHGNRVGCRAALAAVVLSLAALLPLIASPAGAQISVNPEQAEVFVQGTAEILSRVVPVVKDSGSERAQKILREAMRLQNRATSLLVEDRSRMAVELSRRARDGARQSERIARSSLTYKERSRLRLERVVQLRDVVVDAVAGVGHEQARKFIHEADRQIVRAREQYGQTNFEIAFNMAESAEKLLRRAGRLAFEAGGAERLDRFLEGTAELLARARDRIVDPGRAVREKLRQAENQLEEARQARAGGKPVLALRRAQQARELVRRQIAVTGGRDGGPGRNPESVRGLLERWDAAAVDVAAAVAESDDEEARRLLDNARRHRREAEQALAADDIQTALRLVRAAHNALDKAMDRSR